MISEDESKEHGHNETGESQESIPQARPPVPEVAPESNAQGQCDEPQDREGAPQQQTHQPLKQWIRRVRDFLNANAGTVSALATAVIAITTICYTYYERQQGRVLGRQLAVMEAAERPYVGVLSINAVVDANTREGVVTAVLKNFGKNPAAGFWATWEFFINGVKQVGTNAVGPKSKFTFYPGLDHAIRARFRPEKWERIGSGQDELTVRVYVTYELSGGGKHYAECEEQQYFAPGNPFRMIGECEAAATQR